MLLSVAFRALSRALQAVSQGLSRRRAGPGQPQRPPDRYVWSRYRSDLCDACWGKERTRAGILVHADGRIEGSKDDIPPLHPNCDCALKNERTGQFAFGAAGGGPA
jgi:hypothetical protein